MSGKNIAVLSNDGELSVEEYQILAQKTIPELILIIASLKKDSYTIMSIVEDDWMKQAAEWQALYKALETKYQQLSNRVRS